MTTKITDTIKPFVTPFSAPELLDLRAEPRYEIVIKSGVATIYDDGCGNAITVPIWGYDGAFLGPSLLMNRNQQIDITWVNDVGKDETLPCVAVRVASKVSQNKLGIEAGAEPTMGHGCKPRFTTHLHGGKIPPASDGWPESMMMPGQNSLKRYENNQRASLIWYHDHAMHTTRLNVYAGMAGAWIITDEEEAVLQLPDGDKMLPIVIQDRNLSVSRDEQSSIELDKQLSPNELDSKDKMDAALLNNSRVRLLHKVGGLDDTGPMEFFGPLTLVNGRIWPVKDVEPTCYRLRMLNGSNSRTYGLVFAEKNGDGYQLLPSKDVDAAVRQVGSDGGLLKAPVTLPSKQLQKKNSEGKDEPVDTPLLILSPAERADILIDFSRFAGKRIVLLNCAASPFANEFFHPDRLSEVDPDGKDGQTFEETKLLTCPEVMQFSVAESENKSYCFSALESRFKNLHILTGKPESSFTHDAGLLAPCDNERTIAIVEKQEAGKAMLVLWELMTACELEKQAMEHPILSATKSITVDGEKYYVVAERFQDPVSYMVQYGSTERWRFINLTADTHPMHMHLVQFMVQERKGVSVNGQTDADKIKEAVDHAIKVSHWPVIVAIKNEPECKCKCKCRLDKNEQGFKDTIRVNPGEMVEVKAYFDGYMGRYVYHCHLLEHEDHDMMRQFVVTRDDLMPMKHLPISVGKK